MTVGAVLLWRAVGVRAAAPVGPLPLRWWELLPLVAAAQAGLVHFQVRRQAHSMSLCHLPLVVGLACCAPGGFVLARTLGGALAMVVVLRQRGVKLALNTASYLLEAVVATSVVAVLHAAPVPAAMYPAMLIADLTSFTVVRAAIGLYEGRFDPAGWWRPLAWLVPVNVVATSAALVALAALWQGLGYLPLLAGVTAALLLLSRAWSRLRDRHQDLQRLQDLAVSLPALTPEGPEVLDAVEDARRLLVAERAELWLPDGQVVVARQDLPATRVDASGRAPSGRAGRAGRRPAWSSLSTSLTSGREPQDVTLAVFDRLGRVRSFDEDDERLLVAVGALLQSGLVRGADRQRLLETARRDPLTRLWTLPEATRLIDAAHADGVRAGLLILDVVGLQDVNDSLGYEAGDALLRTAARRLADAAGPGAVVARIGGDELLATVDEAAGARASAVAEAVAGAVDVGGVRLELRVRAGACSAEHGDGDLAVLLRRAYAALARADAGGRRYQQWRPGTGVDPARRLRLSSELPAALAAGTVAPVFQPLCRADDLVVVGAEALARWRHPQLGAVPPDEFVAIAEQGGLVGELTRVVLGRALEQARRWRDEGRPLRVSVNLSPRSLNDDGLVEMVQGALVRAGLPASALLLEVTETSLMDDLERAKEVLARLRAAGVETALDDFGTGHSSLASLRDIPVGEVKLDRSFLQGITEDRTTRRIVAAAVSLCHDLGKTVVAEGVEDAQTAELLGLMQVDLLQGYHLGRPLPAAEWSTAAPQVVQPA